MSEFYQSPNRWHDLDPNADLREALINTDMEEFQLALDIGADPLIPNDNGVCVYEMALATNGSEAFVEECLKKGCSPHYVNQRLNKAAINYAADSQDPRIINLILRHSNVMVNKTFCNLTPLNYLAVNIDDRNMDEVIQCMEILICYGASTKIPDDSGMTPSEHLMHNAKLNNANKEKMLEMLKELENNRSESFRLKIQRHSIFDIEAIKPCSHRRGFAGLLSLCTVGCDLCDLKEGQEMGYDGDWYNIFLFFNSIKHKDNISFDEIMTMGMDYNYKLANQTPLECALSAGNSYALKRLLSQPDINIESVKCPFSLVIKNMKEYSGGYHKCFFMLLKSNRIDINETDASASTALHYAVETRNSEAIIELLKRGAFLGARNNSNVLSIDGICPAVLKQYFDSCISSSDIFRIRMKYDNLRTRSAQGGQHHCQKEMPTLAFMAKSDDHRYLLEHPLIISFLQLKWNQLSAIFYINFILFLFFAVSMTTHTVLKFSDSEAHKIIAGFRIMSWIGIGYMMVRECVQLATVPRQYFRSIANYMELTLIALAIINCMDMDMDIDRSKQKVIAVVALLLIAVELFLLCGCLPILSLSTHMLMLKEVSKRFLKSFLLYSIFVVTFSFCFYILFGTEGGNTKNTDGDFNKFTNPLKSLVKTVVMLTGEFDAGDIEFSTLYSYLLFLLFVFLMTIVLYNLLNGLAVSDIQTIMGQAKQNGTVCRIELLNRYEDVVVGRSVYRRFVNLYSAADQSCDIEYAVSKDEDPKINREILEEAENILEQNRLTTKRQHRLQNNENRFNNIENKLDNIFKTLDIKF